MTTPPNPALTLESDPDKAYKRSLWRKWGFGDGDFGSYDHKGRNLVLNNIAIAAGLSQKRA